MDVSLDAELLIYGIRISRKIKPEMPIPFKY
jgi:hypothetical protein